MATIKDVARRAGVSISTVSHVLNRTRFVSPDRHARVEAALLALGYEPNALARSLKLNRSRSIGLVISDIANPFFTDVVRGIEDIAQHDGYTVVLCNSDEDLGKEETYLRELRAKRVDGLILAPAGVAHPYLRALVDDGFPLVFLDREIDELSVSAVLLDNFESAHVAVSRLIALGHRRIAIVAGRQHISSTRERLAGYWQALDQAGLPRDEHLVIWGDSRTEPSRLATLALLSADAPPTAVFSANNLMTIGVLSAALALGLRVPEDLALIGFDDFPWADVFRPRLSTVAQPTYALGQNAASMLLDSINAESAPAPRRVVLAGTLIERESSGPPRLAPTDPPAFPAHTLPVWSHS